MDRQTNHYVYSNWICFKQINIFISRADVKLEDRFCIYFKDFKFQMETDPLIHCVMAF